MSGADLAESVGEGGIQWENNFFRHFCYCFSDAFFEFWGYIPHCTRKYAPGMCAQQVFSFEKSEKDRSGKRELHNSILLVTW